MEMGSIPHGDGLFDKEIYLACLDMKLPGQEGRIASRDIDELLRIHKIPHGRVAGVAYTTSELDGYRKAKAFLREDGKLYSTALVDVDLPGSRSVRQIRSLASGYQKRNVDSIINDFLAEPLQKEIYENLSVWFKRERPEKQFGRNELRHLIRILFVWLLKERGVIPEDVLWLPGTNLSEKPEWYIHDHVLRLFDHVLSTPETVRQRCECKWRESLRKSVPFLNGSIFAPLQKVEQPCMIANADYVGESGLLTILGGYDWTLSEHSGYATESAIDPSMLGNLFERLVLDTDGPRQEPGSGPKMPHGTYYTPQDVADEMVTDAVSGFVQKRLGTSSLHDLFHPAPESSSWIDFNPDLREKLINTIKQVSVLDPCCGSGVFTVAVLQGLWRAQMRLTDSYDRGAEILESIIELQLFASDIHPLAVLITRLRLFIALVDMQASVVRPLPNLETKVVTANTLRIDVSGQGELFNVPEFDQLIGDLGANRELWTTAHLPEEKQEVLNRDMSLRSALKDCMEGWVDQDSDLKWLDMDLLSPSAPSANVDLRKLFPKPEGWDIVIGNPPYQRPDQVDKDLGGRMGYLGAARDLYLMFIQAGLEVTKPGGCMTLITPLSIVFRHHNARAYKDVRDLIERKSLRIDIRTYDNTPQPVFPKLPWLGDGKRNRQRVTILRALLHRDTDSDVNAEVYSRGSYRMNSHSRLGVLRDRRTPQLQPSDDRQWTQAPTPELVQLFTAMRGHETELKNGREVTISKSGMYYITCLPTGRLHNRSRKRFFLAPDEYYWAWIGLYNSHLFHAYWLTISNLMDVTKQQYLTVRKPKGWRNQSILGDTISVTRNLVDPEMVRKCRKDHTGAKGEMFPNCDFHSNPESASLIAELDCLLLQAYALPIEPLLTQMHVIRKGSAHRLNDISA